MMLCQYKANTVLDLPSWSVFAGSDDDEAKIKEETGATLRCIPFDQPRSDLTCFFTGESASEVVIFAKAH